MFIPDKTLRYSGLPLACVLPEDIQMSNLLEKYSEGVVDEPGDPEDGYGEKMIQAVTCFVQNGQRVKIWSGKLDNLNKKTCPSVSSLLTQVLSLALRWTIQCFNYSCSWLKRINKSCLKTTPVAT